MIDSYEINLSTLAIIPVNEKTSNVIEEDNVYTINKSTTEIIDHSCKYFGSSYKGRTEGTKNIIGFSYKLPIIIDELREIIFFPTSSPKKECCWISLNQISRFENNKVNSIIIFKNNFKLELDISYNTLENQILRANYLETSIRKRRNQ